MRMVVIAIAAGLFVGAAGHALWVSSQAPANLAETVEVIEAAERRAVATSTVQRDADLRAADRAASKQADRYAAEAKSAKAALQAARAESDARVQAARQDAAALLAEIPVREKLAYAEGYADGKHAVQRELVQAGLEAARTIAGLRHDLRVAVARSDAAESAAMGLARRVDAQLGPGERFGITLASCGAGAAVAGIAWGYSDPAARDPMNVARIGTVAASGCAIAAVVDGVVALFESSHLTAR